MNKIMKKNIIIRINSIILLIMFALCMTSCGKKEIQQTPDEIALHGEWYYAHDEKETVAEFSKDGSARFEGVKYQYTCDGEYINLTDKNGEVTKLRYLSDGDKMYVYIQSKYTRQPEGGGAGIVGVWRCEDKGWTFEFSNKGTFMEDGALTGYYEIDEEAHTVKLMYGEALEDTVFFYELTENELSMEYPWLMLKR